MFRIGTVINDIDSRLIMNGEFCLEYTFPNKHKLEIINRNYELEFYYVSTDNKRRGMPSMMRAIKIYKANNKTLAEILRDFASVIEEAEKRAEEKYPNINRDEIMRSYFCA